MAPRPIRSLLVLLAAGLLAASLPGVAAARPSQPRRGSVDPYVHQRVGLNARRKIPVLIHTADPSATQNVVQRSVVALAQTLELETLVARGLPQSVDEWLGFARPTAA
jgi:hypothetical protein